MSKSVERRLAIQSRSKGVQKPLTKERVDWAVDVVVSRDGRPREDDWDLVEAARVLAAFARRTQAGLSELVNTLAAASVAAVREGLSK